jgi:hypothetical protein
MSPSASSSPSPRARDTPLAASTDDRARCVPGVGSEGSAVARYAEKLAATSGLPRRVIEFVLLDELRRGRVVVRDGRLRLVREAFAGDVLRALQELEPGRYVDEGGLAAVARSGRPRLGWSARTIARVLPRFPHGPRKIVRAADRGG